jgi:peptide/nickel transport system ATP-binding protein
MMEEGPLLQIEDLQTFFFTRSGTVKAANGVSFSLNKGEIVGLVGESGSGKSVTAFSIMRLVKPPGQVVGGRVLFSGEDLLLKSDDEMRAIRGRTVSMIFQDPVNYLDPLFTAGQAIGEAIRLHQEVSSQEARQQAIQLLTQLKVPSPESVVDSYPFQLSGGMCQRILIATAIASKPALLIADEATSALDVTVQASILRTLRELRDTAGTSVLVTTHNMQVVRKVCTRTMVMYSGIILESGPTTEVLDQPLHPYTAGLLSCVPTLDQVGQALSSIPGEPPIPGSIEKGCVFYPRCPIRRPVCEDVQPSLEEIKPGRWSACPYLQEIDGRDPVTC